MVDITLLAGGSAKEAGAYTARNQQGKMNADAGREEMA
jgi:hypothetical protein